MEVAPVEESMLDEATVEEVTLFLSEREILNLIGALLITVDFEDLFSVPGDDVFSEEIKSGTGYE